MAGIGFVRIGVGDFSAEDRLKAALIGWTVAIDAWWIASAGYSFDFASAVLPLAVMLVLLAVAELYCRWRPHLNFVIMTREMAWMVAFTGAAAILSNLAVTTNLPLIDPQLAAFDRAVGFDWLGWYNFASSHRILGLTLSIVYASALPQVGVVVVSLALIGQVERARELVLAAMIGALIAVVVSTLLPSMGALAFFRPDETGFVAPPIVTLAYKQAFFDLRAGIVPMLSLDSVRGLIAFPSYHATLGVLSVFAVRGAPRLFWLFFVVSLVAFISAPVNGGHHFADMIGGVAVAVASLAVTMAVRRGLNRPVRAPIPATQGVPVSLSETA